MDIMESLFVYGTLKKGQVNHKFIENCRFIDDGVTLKGYCMYDLGEIPVVTDEMEVSPIKGELWRVPKDILEKVDDLEHSLCKRIEVPVIVHMSGTVKAWMYVSTDDKGGTLIREGKWR